MVFINDFIHRGIMPEASWRGQETVVVAPKLASGEREGWLGRDGMGWDGEGSSKAAPN